MRGKVLQYPRIGSALRITPAYAGKRRKSLNGFHGPRDHPRVCGEKCFLCSGSCCCRGSPPRMRGKAKEFRRAQGFVRITPAYAGKSRYLTPKSGEQKDHPRVCGEKFYVFYIGRINLGSPPRMRGKVVRYLPPGPSAGITPAYAGKSFFVPNRIVWDQDHPRVCGEKDNR